MFSWKREFYFSERQGKMLGKQISQKLSQKEDLAHGAQKIQGWRVALRMEDAGEPGDSLHTLDEQTARFKEPMTDFVPGEIQS